MVLNLSFGTANGLHVSPILVLLQGELCDLSASLNPVAPDYKEYLRDAISTLNAYPDSRDATASLALAMGVDPELLVLTNGGSEAIALVANELGRGWADEFDFGLYRRHISELDKSGPCFVSNPHNPTGALLDRQLGAEVIDEAFYPIATGEWTRGDHLRGSYVLGSLTKLTALPGIRLGFVIAPNAKAARRIEAARPQWSVSGLAVAMMEVFMETLDLGAIAQAVGELRARLCGVLTDAGLGFESSSANFVYLPDAPGLGVALLRQGVLVRGCASFGRPNAVRIAVGSSGEIDLLQNALAGLA